MPLHHHLSVHGVLPVIKHRFTTIKYLYTSISLYTAKPRYNIHMIFTLADVTTHFTPDRYTKGWQLFVDGRVTGPNIQRGGELITAVIPRAGSRPYRVYVRIGSELNETTINGECSCAKKHDCEHVVAVLMQALDDQQALTDRGVAAPSRDKTRKPSRPESNQTLLYMLQLDEESVLIESVVARRQHLGGYSSSRSYDPGRASSRNPPRFLQPVDLELLSILDALPRSSNSGLPWLNGPQSTHILKRVLATGRCYFESAELGIELKSSPKRALTFQWLIDDFGYQQGEWKITPEADTLLPFSTPWYIDIDEGQCGPLSTDLPIDIIHELVNQAPVSPEQVINLNKSWLENWPGTAIPPLQVLELETAPRMKPVPCLRLITEEDPIFDEWSDSNDFVCLSFDYGDSNDAIKINRHGPTTCIQNGRLIQVQRDKKSEKSAVKQLQKLGLEEIDEYGLDSRSDCFSFISGFEDDETESWLNFQADDIPTLRAQGWRIEYDHFRLRLTAATNWSCNVENREQSGWFNIELGVEVDGQRVDLLPILLNVLSNFPRGLPDASDISSENFVIPFTNEDEEEHLLSLPTTQILPILQILLEMYDGADRPDNLRLNRAQLTHLTVLNLEDNGPQLQWLGDEDTHLLIQRLRDLDGITAVSPPLGLIATLRPYQQEGLNWLQFLREYQLAGILADDMGLGKTVQALAHLLLEKETGRADRPSLVIAPTSLMFNWRQEAERFAPQLKVLVLHGPERKQHFSSMAEHDLIITTYPLLARDKDTLLSHQYHLLILDEAQVIKNPRAQAGRVVRAINAQHRLCLTGTPMENHLGELWSLFDFLLPGLLGSSKQFRRFFRTPIEKHNNEAVAERLSRRIRPFLLRRTKDQVATELAPKTTIIKSVMLEGKQRELYETVRLAMHRRVREAIEHQGLGRSHIVVLDALLKLRQVCCDPRLVKTNKAKSIKQSAKLEMLMELLPKMLEEGRRILVFSQFTTMLGLIEDELKKSDINYVKLTGQTRDREASVNNFQAGKVPLFLISLKAGGVGLNLTAADTVIHYDPWWNPAVENQATDRAHRIGQQKSVFVYKLICEGTLEEKIQAMQQRKQALADGLYQSGGKSEPQWDEQDLNTLFSPLGKA